MELLEWRMEMQPSAKHNSNILIQVRINPLSRWSFIYIYNIPPRIFPNRQVPINNFDSNYS